MSNPSFLVRYMLSQGIKYYAMRKIMLCLSVLCSSSLAALACTGISLTAADGSYVQARTVEAAAGELESRYVVIPRGEKFTAYTPVGATGLKFEAHYGVVGLTVVNVHFVTEGINEKVHPSHSPTHVVPYTHNCCLLLPHHHSFCPMRLYRAELH